MCWRTLPPASDLLGGARAIVYTPAVDTGTDLTVSGNLIAGMGATGINVLSGAGGGVSLVCNTVQNVAAGQSAYVDQADGGFSVSGSGNVGFTP